MMDSINLIFGCFLNVIVLIYMCQKIVNKKINYLSKEYLIAVTVMTTYWSASYVMTNSIIRILISFLLLVAACIVLLKEKTSKSAIIAFISMIILLVSELLFVALSVLIFKFDENGIQNSVFGTFLTNILILSIAIIMLKFTNNRIKKMLEKISIKNKNSNVYIFLISFTTIIMLIYSIYFEEELFFSLIYSVFIIIAYVIFTIKLIKEKTNNYRLEEENRNMMLSLEEYEKMYSTQRIKNHESKNDLSVLRGMINKNNTKALAYIDGILNLKNAEKYNWMEILKRIPEGGLRGILYYKLLQMQDEKIIVDFAPLKTFNASSYMKLPENIKIKICKLLGIYLDNAIQAVKKSEQKNIYIEINESKSYITFKIANNFKNSIDLDRIFEEGYTTNENGRGFGLHIAKGIIESEDLIINETKIVKDKFIQEIKIVKQKNTTLK